MTREECELSIEYLEGIKDNYIEGNGYERHPLPEYYAIETAIKALEQEPKTITEFADRCQECGAKYGKALEQTRWIPVSERLPKAGEYIGDGDVAKYYLVQNEYGDMMVARYTHSEYWEQIYKLKPIGDEIIAWRELPEPYVPDINVGNINCILDKISNEIKHCREDEEPHLCDYRYYINVGLDMALNIIDNYKTESEDEE